MSRAVSTTRPVSDFLAEWQVWHDAREQRLRSPHGWLAVTGIHWLTATPQRVDDVPGEWSGDAGGVTVTLAPGETLTLDGDPLIEGRHRFGPLDELGLTMGCGDAVVQVADRDGAAIVRPRRPDAPNLTAYRGTPCYPADPAWVVPGRFEPYPGPDGDAVGEVVFEHGGVEHRLVAWGEEDGSLWILFRDATTGVTTHSANRQLLVEPPPPDGGVHLDFNRAIQHAVRLHRLRHLSAAAAGQHAGVRRRGRRADPGEGLMSPE